MRVVDTSAWIEWLTGSALGKKLSRKLPERAQWIVPTIVQLELAKWLTRERGEDEADRVLAFTQKCIVVPLDTNLALLAADVHARHRLATADAIVYASALQQNADLLTCDRHFLRLPGAVVFERVGVRRLH
jgi:predicted nucleic acid-binding protein